jgi:hypothetical protein
MESLLGQAKTAAREVTEVGNADQLDRGPMDTKELMRTWRAGG